MGKSRGNATGMGKSRGRATGMGKSIAIGMGRSRATRMGKSRDTWMWKSRATGMGNQEAELPGGEIKGHSYRDGEIKRQSDLDGLSRVGSTGRGIENLFAGNNTSKA